MILGVGVDIVRVQRVSAALQRFGERFVRRVLAESELGEFRRSARPAYFVARRFALKEAAVKAMGTGLQRGVRMRDIEVSHDALGKPLIAVLGGARAHCERLGAKHYHASISDDTDYAAAMVVIER